MWRFLRNRRLILRLHYYLGASRGGPCDSTALVVFLTSPVLFLTLVFFFSHSPLTARFFILALLCQFTNHLLSFLSFFNLVQFLNLVWLCVLD